MHKDILKKLSIKRTIITSQSKKKNDIGYILLNVI